MTMKVILRENIDSLGRIGDVVRVSEGYARNFLLPRNLVIVADEHNVKEMEHHRKALERRRARSMKDAQSQVAKIEGVSCTITRKSGEQDKLFGSVTSADIAQALKKDGVTVERKQIHLDEPIKQLGVFTVNVTLHPEVTAKLKVWVVAEK